jgi:hypothetical protein
MSLQKFLSDVFHGLIDVPEDIIEFLRGPKFAAFEQRLAKYSQEAFPIVKKIAEAVPNKSLQEVVAAYEKFGVPLLAGSGSSNIGNLMLNLATELLKLSNPSALVSELQTAIQVALALLNGAKN